MPPVALLSVVLIGQAAVPADANSDAAFGVLLAAARADPESADFGSLRLAFTQTSRYQPDSQPDLDPTPVEHELKNGERAAARVALERILDGHWTEIAAHQVAARLAERLNDSARFELHRAFERGLRDSILASGDGRSFATAWRVVSRAEEHALLAHLGLSGGVRTLVERRGRHYALVTHRDERIGREMVVHFDIEIPWQAQRRRVGPDADRREPQP